MHIRQGLPSLNPWALHKDPHGEGWQEKQGCLQRGSEVLTSTEGSGEASVQRMLQLRPEGGRSWP